MMGSEHKSAMNSDESHKVIAFNGGGHALVAINTPRAHHVRKATIIPKGNNS